MPSPMETRRVGGGTGTFSTKTPSRFSKPGWKQTSLSTTRPPIWRLYRKKLTAAPSRRVFRRTEVQRLQKAATRFALLARLVQWG